MSCDPDFQAFERLIQHIYAEYGADVTRYARLQMYTIHVPGKCPADVVQQSWIDFADSVSKDGYQNMLLRDNETPTQRSTRLRNLLFKIVSNRIADHYRENGQKGVRAQVSGDFTSNESKALSNHPQHEHQNGAVNAEQILQHLLQWTAEQGKSAWEVAGSIVGIVNDNDFAGKWTCEELAAEVTHRLRRHVTIHQVRHARKLLLKKARSMPELQPFIFRYES